MPLWTNADTAAGKPQIGGRAYNAEKAREIYATSAGIVKPNSKSMVRRIVFNIVQHLRSSCKSTLTHISSMCNK